MNMQCALISRALQAEAGKAPEWIELLPAGSVVQGRDGRTWVNDRPEAVVTAFIADARPLPIDYEHATEKKGAVGEPAFAVAWVEELELREGAVWGRVEWNEEGREAVSGRKYRYVSPVFEYERETLRIRRLCSVGLTNQPNLRLTALNRNGHQQPDGKEDTVDKLDAAICRELGIAESATPQDALNAILGLKGKLAAAANSEGGVPGLDKFVPRADYDQLKGRAENAENKLKELEGAKRDGEIASVVDQAVKDGKVAPASKDFYVAMCRTEGGLDQFRTFLQTAPAIVSEAPVAPGGDPAKFGADALTPDEKALCRNMGLDPKEYAAAKNDDKAGA
jgi:phage I-like protein